MADVSQSLMDLSRCERNFSSRSYRAANSIKQYILNLATGFIEVEHKATDEYHTDIRYNM